MASTSFPVTGSTKSRSVPVFSFRLFVCVYEVETETRRRTVTSRSVNIHRDVITVRKTTSQPRRNASLSLTTSTGGNQKRSHITHYTVLQICQRTLFDDFRTLSNCSHKSQGSMETHEKTRLLTGRCGDIRTCVRALVSEFYVTFECVLLRSNTTYQATRSEKNQSRIDTSPHPLCVHCFPPSHS